MRWKMLSVTSILDSTCVRWRACMFELDTGRALNYVTEISLPFLFPLIRSVLKQILVLFSRKREYEVFLNFLFYPDSQAKEVSPPPFEISFGHTIYLPFFLMSLERYKS